MPDSLNTGLSAFLREVIEPGMTVIDVGANVGTITALAADLVGQSGVVVAYEPDPKNASVLAGRLANRPQVRVRVAAVSDVSGTVQLYRDSENSRRHSMFGAAVSVPGDVISVQSIRLDDEMPDGPVTLLKVDAQGAEPRILRGARALLRRDRPVLVLEVWPMAMHAAGVSPDAMLSELEAEGYRLVRLSVKGRQKPRQAITSFLAQPASRWASINVVAWPR